MRKKKAIRETSLDAYLKVKPFINKSQMKVLDAIEELDAPTDMEIAKHLKMDIRGIGPRRHELMKMKMIKSDGKRKCSITDRMAMTWMINSENTD